MAVVIAYVKDKEGFRFLVGKESIYLRDVMGRELISEHETHAFPPNTRVGDVHEYFSNKAVKLSKHFNVHIQYDTPKYDSTTGIGKVRFRVLADKSMYGVIKGGMEPVDKGDPLKTAVREFKEEFLMIPIYSESMIDMGIRTPENRKIYYINLTPLAHLIPKAIAMRKTFHYGELFESDLLTYSQICMNWRRFNNTSKIALNAFFKKAGLKNC